MFSFGLPSSRRFEEKCSFFLTVYVRKGYISKLNVISYWHVSSWLAFFPVVAFISSSDRKFYAISIMIVCNIRTITEIQVHRQNWSVFRHFIKNTISPPMKTGISQLLYLLHFSICSVRGFFQKNYFNKVQLTYHIWTANSPSLVYWNFFQNIKSLLTFHGVTMKLYGGKKKKT